MTVYSLISSLLSYVFTTIIYLFIFSVICLIYMDIKKMNKSEKTEKAGDGAGDYEDSEYERTAILRTIWSEDAAACKMKKLYRIGEDATIVGRGKQCDITINDMFLSVEHFQIWCDDGIWYIGDMGSRNGTLLNDVRLKSVHSLEDGDEISFGGLKFTFEEE